MKHSVVSISLVKKSGLPVASRDGPSWVVWESIVVDTCTNSASTLPTL